MMRVLVVGAADIHHVKNIQAGEGRDYDAIVLPRPTTIEDCDYAYQRCRLDGAITVSSERMSPLARLRAAHAHDPITLLKIDLYERAVEVGDHHTALQILSDHRIRMPRASKASDTDVDG